VRLLADECCDAGVVASLREAGHDVRYVLETDRGIDDVAVITSAASEERILLTEDKDFGDLVYRHGHPVTGVVLLRIDPSRRDYKWPRLNALIQRFGDRLAGNYTTVHEDRFRFRPLHRPS
jgi:predicted nuclease of predicted toxin-antitoxin system